MNYPRFSVILLFVSSMVSHAAAPPPPGSLLPGGADQWKLTWSDEFDYGAFSSREFTLLGDAVNLVFRLESLTRALGQHVLVSADLLAGWSAGLACCRNLGHHPVKGRDQLVEVHALERDPSVSEANGA